jgi:recombination protein RecT
MATNQLAIIDKFQKEIESEFVQGILAQSLKENADTFTTSLVEIFSSESSLQECSPSLIISEAMKAASLRLPITKGLGQAFIIAYKGKPSFQIGYKGYIQLAIRSGLYETINADVVYEGELTRQDKLKGTFDLNGQKTSDEVIGYFAHIELKNGFSKTLYMSKDKVIAHAKKYSKTFNSEYSPWKNDFDQMALKTVLKAILSHYGTLSVEMQSAFNNDIDEEISTNANTENVTFTEAVVVSTEQPKVEDNPAPKKKAAF